MRTMNYSEARQNLAEEFELYQTARLDDEFADIMMVHGNEIRALADK